MLTCSFRGFMHRSIPEGHVVGSLPQCWHVWQPSTRAALMLPQAARLAHDPRHRLPPSAATVAPRSGQSWEGPGRPFLVTCETLPVGTFGSRSTHWPGPTSLKLHCSPLFLLPSLLPPLSASVDVTAGRLGPFLLLPSQINLLGD